MQSVAKLGPIFYLQEMQFQGTDWWPRLTLPSNFGLKMENVGITNLRQLAMSKNFIY